jgi:drug/metabolite transporter (DMT)-like permease
LITWYNGLKYVDVSLATAILLLGSPITSLLKFKTGTPINAEQAFGILLLVLGVVTFMNSTNYFSVNELMKSWTNKTKV